MPRIDPVTGCSVLTAAEFWQAEARAEGRGRTGADLMHDFLTELDDDTQRTAQAYRDDLPGTTRLLQKALADVNDGADPEDQLPALVSVTEIIEVALKETFRHSHLHIRARATRDGGDAPVEDILNFTHSASSGSRLEPPDEDYTIAWESLTPDTDCP